MALPNDLQPLPVGPPPPQAPATAGVARLENGAALAYWDTGGDGPAMVLAHPHSGNLHSWPYQQPVFVDAGYRVIAYSRRGYAGSGRDAADVGTQASDLAALLDLLGVARCFVVGSAAGGTTALDFALSFPDRVRAAVVASSMMSIADPEYRAALARARGDGFADLPIATKELGPGFRAMDPEGAARWLAIHALNGDVASNRQPPLARIDWTALARNKTPLLLLTGGADLYMPPALQRRAAARIGASECAVVPDAGHAAFCEAPTIFNRLVLDFFARFKSR